MNRKAPDAAVPMVPSPPEVFAPRFFAGGKPVDAPTLSDEVVDKHLDAVLRAAGSGLRHYTMPKSLSDMRAAMRAAMTDGVLVCEICKRPSHLGRCADAGRTAWAPDDGVKADHHWHCITCDSRASTPLTDETTCKCSDIYDQQWVRENGPVPDGVATSEQPRKETPGA